MKTRKHGILFGGVAAMIFLAFPVFAQPPGYSSDDVVSAGVSYKIGLAWGDQMQPSQFGMKAVTNLQRAASQAGLPITAGDQIRLSSANLEEYAVIFVITDAQFQLSDTEKKKLRDFVSRGGMIVLDDPNAAMPASQSLSAMKQMIDDVTGKKRLQMIKNDHAIYRTPNKLDGPPMGADTSMTTVGKTLDRSNNTYLDNKVDSGRGSTLEGVTSGDRLTMLLTSKGYSPKWSEYSNNDPQMKFGVNIIAYAVAQKKAARK